jgi:hypothetical protein
MLKNMNWNYIILEGRTLQLNILSDVWRSIPSEKSYLSNLSYLPSYLTYYLTYLKENFLLDVLRPPRLPKDGREGGVNILKTQILKNELKTCLACLTWCICPTRFTHLTELTCLNHLACPTCVSVVLFDSLVATEYAHLLVTPSILSYSSTLLVWLVLLFLLILRLNLKVNFKKHWVTPPPPLHS